MVSDFETRSYKPQQILEYPSLLSVSLCLCLYRIT